MKLLWSLAVGVVIAAAQPSLAQPGGPAACVVRGPNEASAAWSERTRQSCEVSWRDLVSHKATGAWTHPSFIRSCLRRCGVDVELGQNPGPPVGPIGAGVLLASGVLGLTLTNGGNEKPASP
jgi:hypothetical protein